MPTANPTVKRDQNAQSVNTDDSDDDGDVGTIILVTLVPFSFVLVIVVVLRTRCQKRKPEDDRSQLVTNPAYNPDRNYDPALAPALPITPPPG